MPPVVGLVLSEATTCRWNGFEKFVKLGKTDTSQLYQEMGSLPVLESALVSLSRTSSH